MPLSTPDAAALVRKLADALGFALVGIAPAVASEHADHVRRWLAEGRHGQMEYLRRDLEQRLDPAVLLPGARSVICLADRYEGQDPAEQGPRPRGKIARYAWGKDYHRVIKKRLHRIADELRVYFPGENFRGCVDTAPTLEREHALRAGLGWIGKNTMLIHPRQGSWLLLGVIVTTLELEASPSPMADHCGTCRRCIDACPTRCIADEGYTLDASRCVSYLTIEHRGVIDPALFPEIGDWIAGCDICQEACPFNPREQTGPSSSLPRDGVRASISLLDVLHWDAAARQRALVNSALKRIRLDMWKRNALIAAGHHLAAHTDADLLARIRELADDEREPPLVRQTAKRVLDRLQGIRR